MPDLSEYELVTQRLRLVPCHRDHLEGLHAIDSDPEVMRYITGKAQTRSETESMIERVNLRWQTIGYSWWTIIELQTREIVGAGCLQNLRRHGSEPDPLCPLEIGWRIRQDKWRTGIGTEAASVMADFAFARLHAEVLYAVCHPDHKASMGVMLKLGMRYDGMDEWYAQQVATFVMTAEAWRTARGTMN